MNVAVIGTGYVGLVTGACLSNFGHKVTCVDSDASKVEQLANGTPTIYEPGIEQVMALGMENNALSFTTDLLSAVRNSLCIFITVGTPQSEDGAADISAVMAAARDIAIAIREVRAYRVVVIKSTVPVGTCALVERTMREMIDNEWPPVDVVSNPEFLREGSAVDDFTSPDRVVVGASDPRAATLVSELFRDAVGDSCKLLVMDTRSAEMTKYASNAMLAARISFMNEIASLCEATGADVGSVRAGMALDSRIGAHFLEAGIGYGGSCFPKDVLALMSMLRENGIVDDGVICGAHRTNERQHGAFVAKILRRYGGAVRGKKFMLWGVAFKQNTDDTRESPGVKIARGLLASGAAVVAYDPKASAAACGLVPAESPYDVSDCDAVIVASPWAGFRKMDLARIAAAMREPVMFDGRNLYDPSVMERAGIEYVSVGRRHGVPHSVLSR